MEFGGHGEHDVEPWPALNDPVGHAAHDRYPDDR
jgi:hypothetical protein